MTNTVNPTKVVTGLTRLSYANIWQAKSINGGAPKFSTSVLIPKSDTVTVTKIKTAKEHDLHKNENEGRHSRAQPRNGKEHLYPLRRMRQGNSDGFTGTYSRRSASPL